MKSEESGLLRRFICLMLVLAMPAHAASKADELLQLVNAERAQLVWLL